MDPGINVYQKLLAKLEPVNFENPWFSVRNRGGFFTVEYRLHIAILPIVNQDQL